MTRLDDGIYAALVRRGMSRRSFLKFSAAMASALALPASYAPRIAAAVEAAPKLPVVWLRGQSCSGNTQAFMRAAKPTITELLLDLLSLDYFEHLMVSTGAGATGALTDTTARRSGQYILVVEGAVPTIDGGTHCLVGGRPIVDIVREVSSHAIGTIAVGACAFDGGAPASRGGSTGAVGAERVLANGPLVALPGCPLNTDNLVATIVHYMTFKQFPVTDGRHRPLFAYGGLIHNQCERRAFFEFGQFVQGWGDEGAQKGWCLYKMGCKGPETYANCPTQQYAEATSWAVKAGHGCIGCTMPGFWDSMGDAYRRLPSPVPFMPQLNVDTVGQLLVGGVAALTVVHGSASYVRSRVSRRSERTAAAAAGTEAVAVVVAATEQRIAPADPAATEATEPTAPSEPPSHRAPGAEGS
jgi:hydrogenase small subunit